MTQRSQSSYRVIRRLATGGMAEVFLAESESVADFSKTVAIKRVLPHLARNEKFVRMFLDEARLAARLNHRNIVQVFDVGEVGDAYFLVMEYVDGTTVKDIIEHYARSKRRVPVNIAVHIAIEMCNGLEYAHRLKDRNGKRLGVVHRDISPANVLVSRAGGVRITDFGLAKAASQAEKTDPGVVKGKYGYLAPETASGAEADAKADQFATGVVLWEMLTARRLFQGATNAETVQLVRMASVPSLRDDRKDIPAALDRTLARALARDKADRFDSCAALSRTLTEILFEHRLAVSAQDLINVVSNVVGADGTGPVRAATPADLPDTPDPAHRFEIHSIAERSGSPSPPTIDRVDDSPSGPEIEASPAPDVASTLPDRDSTDPAPSRPWMPVSTPPPPMERPERSRRRWPWVMVGLLAVAAGGAAAVRDRATAQALWQRAQSIVRATRASAHVASPAAASRAELNSPVHTAEPLAIATRIEPAPPPASESPHPDDPPPTIDQPTYAMQLAIEHAVEARLGDCISRFGHHNRHARVQVVYDGATGRPSAVNLVDQYFISSPIGACVIEAVRAESAPRFRNTTWSTGYSFMIH